MNKRSNSYIFRLSIKMFLVIKLMLAIPVLAKSNVQFELPEAVELAMVVAVLSDVDPDGLQINRKGSYIKEIESYFSASSKHELFQVLGGNFNVPRLAGNAADFKFDSNGNLVEVDTSGSLWGDSQGDLFRKYIHLLQDFANKSKFQIFYENHRAFYEGAIATIEERTDSLVMTSWLEDNFTARPGPLQIIVSPLIGGLNWTSLFKPNIRMWVAPNSAPIYSDLSDYERILNAYPVFTELDHSYVNPQTKKILPAVAAGFSNIDDWISPNSSASNYSSPELQFNEYMTWTVYLMYAMDSLDREDFARLSTSITDFMVMSRGFKAFKEFCDQALQLYSEKDTTAEEVMNKMALWAKDYSMK